MCDGSRRRRHPPNVDIRLFAFDFLDFRREPRFYSGGGVAVYYLVRCGLVDFLSRGAKSRFGLFDIAILDGFDNLLVFRPERGLRGPVSLAETDTLFQTFFRALDIRHGVKKGKRVIVSMEWIRIHPIGFSTSYRLFIG